MEAAFSGFPSFGSWHDTASDSESVQRLENEVRRLQRLQALQHQADSAASAAESQRRAELQAEIVRLQAENVLLKRQAAEANKAAEEMFSRNAALVKEAAAVTSRYSLFDAALDEACRQLTQQEQLLLLLAHLEHVVTRLVSEEERVDMNSSTKAFQTRFQGPVARKLLVAVGYSQQDGTWKMDPGLRKELKPLFQWSQARLQKTVEEKCGFIMERLGLCYVEFMNSKVTLNGSLVLDLSWKPFPKAWAAHILISLVCKSNLQGHETLSCALSRIVLNACVTSIEFEHEERTFKLSLGGQAEEMSITETFLGKEYKRSVSCFSDQGKVIEPDSLVCGPRSFTPSSGTRREDRFDFAALHASTG